TSAATTRPRAPRRASTSGPPNCGRRRLRRTARSGSTTLPPAPGRSSCSTPAPIRRSAGRRSMPPTDRARSCGTTTRAISTAVALVGPGARQVVDGDDPPRDLVVRHALVGPLLQLDLVEGRALDQPHRGDGDLTLAFVRQSEHRRLEHVGVLLEGTLDLEGVH